MPLAEQYALAERIAWWLEQPPDPHSRAAWFAREVKEFWKHDKPGS